TVVALKIGFLVVSEYKFNVRPTTATDFLLPREEEWKRDAKTGTFVPIETQTVITVDPFRSKETKHMLYLHATADNHYRLLGVGATQSNNAYHLNCVFPSDKIPMCIAQFMTNVK